MTRADHWNTVFRSKRGDDVSWFEPLPEISLRLLEAAGLREDTCVLDIGGGDSHLIDATRLHRERLSRSSTLGSGACGAEQAG